MISHTHKAIFIHVPKVAGQSVEQMFLATLGLDWSERGALLLRQKNPNEKGPKRLAHLTAEQYVSLGYIDQKQFEAYYKFSLVRNPYQRSLSCYHFLGYARIMSFETFATKVLPKKIKQNDFFFKPQYDYLYDQGGHLLADFVGHLETLDQDIVAIKARCNMPEAFLPHANKERGSWKRVLRVLWEQPALVLDLQLGQDKIARGNALTPKAKAQVFKYYQMDFEAFNYVA
ncbi:MAG: hypothetical protein ABR84_05920 [Cryomorphaceae bacterium BACL21 MAG-121220-bin10]|jgi:hypothetical protein|nr:MAG: hypothetical protein ABR84_05920 [Cryomorphaceae bacterium BACL21 MAG-121220-bin10]|tara:strand:+ start:25973 stop:26662 length:690 start_codon:yes stop_codon:yes gene_type:complete